MNTPPSTAPVYLTIERGNHEKGVRCKHPPANGYRRHHPPDGAGRDQDIRWAGLAPSEDRVEGGWEMNDSNRTLRFNRTSREAFGHWAKFQPDHHPAEPWLWAVAIFVIGFLIGVMV